MLPKGCEVVCRSDTLEAILWLEDECVSKSVVSVLFSFGNRHVPTGVCDVLCEALLHAANVQGSVLTECRFCAVNIECDTDDVVKVLKDLDSSLRAPEKFQTEEALTRVLENSLKLRNSPPCHVFEVLHRCGIDGMGKRGPFATLQNETLLRNFDYSQVHRALVSSMKLVVQTPHSAPVDMIKSYMKAFDSMPSSPLRAGECWRLNASSKGKIFELAAAPGSNMLGIYWEVKNNDSAWHYLCSCIRTYGPETFYGVAAGMGLIKHIVAMTWVSLDETEIIGANITLTEAGAASVDQVLGLFFSYIAYVVESPWDSEFCSSVSKVWEFHNMLQDAAPNEVKQHMGARFFMERGVRLCAAMFTGAPLISSSPLLTALTKEEVTACASVLTKDEAVIVWRVPTETYDSTRVQIQGSRGISCTIPSRNWSKGSFSFSP